MMRIFLIRHGETEWNKTKRLQGNSDVQLSSNGIGQAQLLEKYLDLYLPHADAIYSSTLSRAVDTAKILAKHFKLPVTTMPELCETNFGDWEGRIIQELIDEEPYDFGKFFTSPERCHPPNGETFIAAQARAIIGIQKIIAEHDNQNVLVVAHGSINRLIIGAALDMPIHKIWSVGQFNTAVNILCANEGNLVVELLNCTTHLQLP